jgi:predicted nuclease of predicted toxin-antitoxin system
MKILLDECLPVRLKNYPKPFKVFSVSEMGWRSLKNGKLLKVAVENNFDVLLTVDKKLEDQQNLDSFNLAVVVFIVARNKIELIKPLLPKFIELSHKLKKGKSTIISS